MGMDLEEKSGAVVMGSIFSRLGCAGQLFQKSHRYGCLETVQAQKAKETRPEGNAGVRVITHRRWTSWSDRLCHCGIDLNVRNPSCRPLRKHQHLAGSIQISLVPVLEPHPDSNYKEKYPQSLDPE